MEQRAQDGIHLASASTEERLRDVVNSFHSSHGLAAKHRLDEEKFRSVLNVISGTCADSRFAVRKSLNILYSFLHTFCFCFYTFIIF